MKMKVGLALGGGGARGIAHLGVYMRLVELGVPVHCVAGTSIGAIAGAFIAAGTVDRALAWCAEPDWRKFPKLVFDTHLTAKALTTGRRVERLLADLIAEPRRYDREEFEEHEEEPSTPVAQGLDIVPTLTVAVVVAAILLTVLVVLRRRARRG